MQGAQRPWLEPGIFVASSELAASGAAIRDGNGTVRRVNHALVAVTWYSLREAGGHNARLLGSSKQHQPFHQNALSSVPGTV